MIDEPVGYHTGGQVAAPVFKKVAEPILRYMSVPPDVPSYAPQYKVKEDKEPAAKYIAAAFSPRLIDSDPADGFGDIIIPDFHGKSLREVTEESLKTGLRLQSVGSGAAVEQMPPPGVSVRTGARVQVRFSARASQR